MAARNLYNLACTQVSGARAILLKIHVASKFLLSNANAFNHT